jgi:Putative prokaryotic signal transducing protein
MAVARLTVVPNELEAEVICGVLRNNGVVCFYRTTDAAAGGLGSEGVGMGGPTEVVVDETDLDAARKPLSSV